MNPSSFFNGRSDLSRKTHKAIASLIAADVAEALSWPGHETVTLTIAAATLRERAGRAKTVVLLVPPGGTGKDASWIDIHENDLNEGQIARWIRQAAALPGWGKA